MEKTKKDVHGLIDKVADSTVSAARLQSQIKHNCKVRLSTDQAEGIRSDLLTDFRATFSDKLSSILDEHKLEECFRKRSQLIPVDAIRGWRPNEDPERDVIDMICPEVEKARLRLLEERNRLAADLANLNAIKNKHQTTLTQTFGQIQQKMRDDEERENSPHEF